MKCPRDSHKLAPRHEGARKVWTCSSCEGALVRGGSNDWQLRRAAPIEREEWDTPVTCPVDGTAMTHFRLGLHSVDACSSCRSVWLDPDEVEQLLEDAGASQARRRNSAWSEADLLSPLLNYVLPSLFDGL